MQRCDYRKAGLSAVIYRLPVCSIFVTLSRWIYVLTCLQCDTFWPTGNAVRAGSVCPGPGSLQEYNSQPTKRCSAVLRASGG